MSKRHELTIVFQYHFIVKIIMSKCKMSFAMSFSYNF